MIAMYENKKSDLTSSAMNEAKLDVEEEEAPQEEYEGEGEAKNAGIALMP